MQRKVDVGMPRGNPGEGRSRRAGWASSARSTARARCSVSHELSSTPYLAWPLPDHLVVVDGWLLCPVQLGLSGLTAKERLVLEQASKQRRRSG